jgi:hypothetical protein
MPRQPLLLLLLGPERVDGVHRQRALHTDQGADPGVAGLEFQAGHAVGDRRRPLTAVALEVHPEHSELAEFAGEVAGGDLAGFEPVGDLRLDARVHEVAHHIADRTFLVIEQGVDAEQLEGGLCLHGLLL